MRTFGVVIVSMLLGGPAFAHGGIDVMDAHLGQKRRTALRLAKRKSRCKPMSRKQRAYYVGEDHSLITRSAKSKSRVSVLVCRDRVWREARIREYHFSRGRLARVVLHIDPGTAGDRRAGEPWIPKYKELKALLSGAVGDPDEVREHVPKSFADDPVRALEQRRGGYWARWAERVRGRVDMGLRLSGDRQKPGEILFYVDIRGRSQLRSDSRRRKRKIRPRYNPY